MALLAAGFFGHVAGASITDLLCVLPALMLAAVLLAGRYPGERAIGRLRRALAPRRRARAPRARRPRARLAGDVRGGRLIGLSLAGRAPPLTAGCR